VRAVFVDASASLGDAMRQLRRADDMPVLVNRQPSITPEELPDLLGDAAIAIIDHTALPTAIAARCAGLRHVVFLGTGARSYMNPEELAARGIAVHTIKGYGDIAVAECAFALMWAAAKGICRMDREMRRGNWLRSEAMQLTGKTLGLIGFGGIGAQMARLSLGAGMRVLAWNRSPRQHDGVAFVDIDTLLVESHVVSLHLLLEDATRGFLSRERIGGMRDGAILVNTARGGLVDEAAMLAALASGKLAHAGLDVFAVEPLPAGHPLTRLENVSLSAHSAFRTPEASENLMAAALDHCRRIAR
jgi:D-3-phosphoglycerate dehydrogenase